MNIEQPLENKYTKYKICSLIILFRQCLIVLQKCHKHVYIGQSNVNLSTFSLFAVPIYFGATVAPLVVLIIVLVLLVVVLIVILKRSRRDGAAQRRDKYHATLQSAHDSRLGEDKAMGGYETIPGINTGKGPAHVQREGHYKELTGEQKGHEPVYAMINKTFECKDDEHNQIKDRETNLDTTSNDSQNLPATTEKTQNPHKKQCEEGREVETDSTDSAPELPTPYISKEDLASPHPSERSGAGTPTQN